MKRQDGQNKCPREGVGDDFHEGDGGAERSPCPLEFFEAYTRVSGAVNSRLNASATPL